MTETAETVTPIDIELARSTPNDRHDYERALNEIECLRLMVAYYVKAMRLRAGYKPEGKS